MRFHRPVNQRLAKKLSKIILRLVRPFEEPGQAQLVLSWRPMLLGMVDKYVQFVDNLFIAILQCMLSTNVNVYGTLASGSKYLFMKLLLISSSNIYYLSAFFASLRQVTAKRCAKALTDFVS